MTRRRHSPTRPWYLYALVALAVALIVLAITEVGPPTSSARTSREIVQAQAGVVQSTVSGTGNVEPATEQTVNFRTSGTLQTVSVHVGQRVSKGQLIATLDPSSAELAVAQAQAQLTAAEDQLTAAKDGTASGSGSGTTAGASLTGVAARSELVAYTTPAPRPATPRTAPAAAPRSPAPTSRAAAPTPRAASGGTRTVTVTVPAKTTPTTPSPAQIASAQASVDSAEASLRSAETELADTKLYAPVAGTVASIASISPGQSVSAGGSASGSGGGSGASGGTGASGGASGAGSLGGSSSSAGGGSSASGSGFAEIIDSSALTMTVAFSESDITSVRVGEPATVSIDALTGVELAGHVTSISPLGTTSSGVVSYDATITLDQTNAQVRPGMSATASVITRQAQGVTLPNQAITGSGSTGTVMVERGGRTVSRPVVVGLRGSSRTQIVSGLSAGQNVVVTVTLLPLGTTTSSSGSGTLGGGRLGGGLFRGGGGAGFFGGGGGGLLRRLGGP